MEVGRGVYNMPNKILEKIIEPSKIEVGTTFLIKIKVERIKSHNLMTENSTLTVKDINKMTIRDFNNKKIERLIGKNNSINIITEDGEELITEGDYYE